MAEGEDGKVYKKIEVVGTSRDSVSRAIRNAVDRAEDTVRELRWFEVTETRGRIEEGEIVFQVDVEIGFRLE